MMKTLHIQVDGDGKVVWSLMAEHRNAPWIDTGLTARPKPPEAEDMVARMVWKDGTIDWELQPVQKQSEPAPAPEEPPAPTHEEIEQARAAAYRGRVDPITCEISRLRDMGGTADEIAEAEVRRDAAVLAIKAQWPYPDEDANNLESR